MTTEQQSKVKDFYNNYWPKNIPDFTKTKKHILSLLPQKMCFNQALDAGCGTGVCTIALAEVAKKVIGLDISNLSLQSARVLIDKLNIKNVKFIKGNVLNLTFANQSFDLILSWGVIHHTDNPSQALDELVRVLKPNGILILAVYLKTNLTPFHEVVRHLCINTPFFPKRLFIKIITFTVKFAELFGKTNNPRDDNVTIESQVEDWFFVPQKHFFTIEEGIKELENRGLKAEVLNKQTGRFKSSSNFILRGIKTNN